MQAMSKASGLSMSALCWNLTILRDGQPAADQIPGPLTVRLLADQFSMHNGSTNGSSVDQSGPEFSSRDKHALLYIIVVLLFYSTGIVIAIVNYLKREKKEIEEEKAYEDYAVFRSDPDKMARYFRVQRMISYLNKVEEAREAEEAALKDRLQGRASCPLPSAATSNEHPSKMRVAASFSVGSDHVIKSPFKHKSHHHVVPGPEAEVDDARRRGQGASVDCCCREGVGENGDEATDHDHPPLRTRISHV